jgi:hypothetical protein
MRAKHNKAVQEAASESRGFSDIKTEVTYNWWYPIDLGVIIR